MTVVSDSHTPAAPGPIKAFWASLTHGKSYSPENPEGHLVKSGELVPRMAVPDFSTEAYNAGAYQRDMCFRTSSEGGDPSIKDALVFYEFKGSEYRVEMSFKLPLNARPNGDLKLFYRARQHTYATETSTPVFSSTAVTNLLGKKTYSSSDRMTATYPAIVPHSFVIGKAGPLDSAKVTFGVDSPGVIMWVLHDVRILYETFFGG